MNCYPSIRITASVLMSLPFWHVDCVHAQETGENIDLISAISSTSGGSEGEVFKRLKRIRDVGRYDLLVVVCGEFPERAEIIAIRSKEAVERTPHPDTSSSPSPWIMTYFPRDGTRASHDLEICFEGEMPDSLARQLGSAAWEVTSKAAPGIQQTNEARLPIPWRFPEFFECFVFIRDNGKFGGSRPSGSLLGSRIFLPIDGTKTAGFLELALSVREKMRRLADESYPWYGNLDMEKDYWYGCLDEDSGCFEIPMEKMLAMFAKQHPSIDKRQNESEGPAAAAKPPQPSEDSAAEPKTPTLAPPTTFRPQEVHE